MHFGFSDKKRPGRLEDSVDLQEEFTCISHLMDHPECEGKIHLTSETDIVVFREQESNTPGHSVFFRALSRNGQHFLLEIN